MFTWTTVSCSMSEAPPGCGRLRGAYVRAVQALVDLETGNVTTPSLVDVAVADGLLYMDAARLRCESQKLLFAVVSTAVFNLMKKLAGAFPFLCL
jgi:hypothetical protein